MVPTTFPSNRMEKLQLVEPTLPSSTTRMSSSCRILGLPGRTAKVNRKSPYLLGFARTGTWTLVAAWAGNGISPAAWATRADAEAELVANALCAFLSASDAGMRMTTVAESPPSLPTDAQESASVATRRTYSTEASPARCWTDCAGCSRAAMAPTALACASSRAADSDFWLAVPHEYTNSVLFFASMAEQLQSASACACSVAVKDGSAAATGALRSPAARVWNSASVVEISFNISSLSAAAITFMPTECALRMRFTRTSPSSTRLVKVL